ncbi:MAG: RNA methyltransferase [Deltaproteobacteria bacterium]|nr:RNA methyltransferase [Deltaproteobacteria bacterium]
MNSIIIFPEEFTAQNLAVLRGVRAHYALQVHDLKVGLTVAAAKLGGERGRASVKRADPQEVWLETDLTDAPFPVLPYELIVAVPRPQTVRKVAQIAATLGLSRVHIIRSANVEKSYLSSRALTPENLLAEGLKGLEQSGGSLLPEVMVHRRFRPFLEDYLSPRLGELKPALKVVATPGAKCGIDSLKFSGGGCSKTALVAIGPESGWNNFEVLSFERLGFKQINLGVRILRVESALIWLIAQLELLKDIS